MNLFSTIALLIQEGGLKIDWTQMPTYNTIMAVAAGAGLILMVRFGRELQTTPRSLSIQGYSLAFGVLGTILTITGAHMSLTWPLAAYFPFDNIIFGEPSFGFGVLMLGAAFYGWKKGSVVLSKSNPDVEFSKTARPISIFIAGLGLGLIAIAVAGVNYQLFAAPPEEPITGMFAAYPLVEAIFISSLYALVGVGAIFFPWCVSKIASRRTLARRITGIVWGIAGWIFLIFGAVNFFTHIGLIVNTM